MSYGTCFPLWRTGAPDWDPYVRAPFVQSLADGSLPRGSFLSYLAQDYIFLIHFSRAWSLADTKAGSLARMRACSATVHALLETEIRLHVDLCGRAGITEADLADSYDPAYAEWIATYGGVDYQALCHDTAALIDSAVASRLGPQAHTLPRWKQLQERISTATRLEAAFWTLAP